MNVKLFQSQFWMRLKDDRYQPGLYSEMRRETHQTGSAKKAMRTGLTALSLSPTPA